jgi:Ca2+-binding EF-hand superfamily protein
MNLTQDSDTITFVEMQKTALDLLASEKWCPDSSATLLQAFQTIDTENKGYLPSSVMEKLLKTQDSFFDKEVDEFLAFAKDRKTGLIYYDDYIAFYSKHITG